MMSVIYVSLYMSPLFQAHIANLFRSKFSDYKDFHTMLYTCAAEFDFMKTEVMLYISEYFNLHKIPFYVSSSVIQSEF